MLATGGEQCRNCISWGNVDLRELISELGTMADSRVQSVKIDDIKHQKTKQATLGHLSDLFKWKATSNSLSGVWSNEHRCLFDFFETLGKDTPRFLQILGGRIAFDIKGQVFCGRVSIVGQTKHEIESVWSPIRLERDPHLHERSRYKSALADDIILTSNFVAFTNQATLPPSEGRSGARNEERERRYWVSPPIILMFVALMICGWGVWRLDRGHGVTGTIAVILSGVLVAISVAWLCIVLTETADAFSGNDVSAPRYSGTEDIGVIPVIVAEFEFRNVQRQILAADLVESAHDTAFNQRPEAIDPPTLVLPEAFEPIGRQFRILGRMLDVLVPQVGLQAARIVAVVGELVAAGVPQHVRVYLECREPSRLARTREHLGKTVGGERGTTLGHEHERRRRYLLALETAQGPQLAAGERLRGRRAILPAAHVQHGAREADLIPAQVTSLRRPQPVPVDEQDAWCRRGAPTGCPWRRR
jgi:hypothetical protein